LAIGYEEGVSAAYEALQDSHDHGAAGHAHDHAGAGHGDSHGHAHSHGDGGGITRTVQSTIGLGMGLLGFSVAIGALFSVAFAVLYGRVGNISARLLSVYLAAGMLLSLYIVPALKYPPSPPALSLDETIRQRTLLYLLTVVVSAALLAGAVYLGRRLVPRLGAWNATLAAAGAYLAAVAVLFWVLPSINETPGPVVDAAGTIVYEGFPADVLYEFRLYSLGTQVVMYTTIALVFAASIARLTDGPRNRSAVTT